MQRGKRQVARLSDSQRHLDRFEVSHFANEHNVGVLTQGRTQRRAERMSIGCDLVLIDDAVLVTMLKLDRVFDSQNIVVAGRVSLFLPPRPRRASSRPGAPGCAAYAPAVL